MSGRRVVLVSPGWPRAAFANGIVSYVDHMKRAFESLGAEVRVASYEIAPGGEEAFQIRNAFARRNAVTRLVTRAGWRLNQSAAALVFGAADAYAAARDAHRAFPYDLLEIEESRGDSLWMARAAPAPVVVRLHGPWFLNAPARGVREDRAFRGIVRREGRAIREADGVTSPSRDTLERVRAKYGFALPNAAVIPNPGPEPDPASLWKLEAAEPGLVAFVGRFDRHKGGDIVVDAFVKLAATGRRVRLVMAGRDDGVVDDAGKRWSFPEYLAARVPAELRGSIELLGQVPPAKLVELRKRASVVVFASRYENFPLALLESLAQGCPLVSCDTPSCREIVEDGKNALLFPTSDSSAFAKRLAELLDHPESAAALGESALADYRARFLPGRIARVTLDYYEEVLARRQGR